MQYCTRPLMIDTSPETGRDYVVIFCRVLLGTAKNTDEMLTAAEATDSNGINLRPPTREDGMHWDSVISNPGQKRRAGDGGIVVHNQAHREFVVFSRDQIYPVYIVRFQVH